MRYELNYDSNKVVLPLLGTENAYATGDKKRINRKLRISNSKSAQELVTSVVGEFIELNDSPGNLFIT